MPAISAQTTFADGALSCAKLGRVIGVGETVGERDPVGVGVGAGAVLADGGAVVALDVAGGAAQALKSTSSEATATQRIRNIN